jgi:hypothetical protein
MLTYPSHDPVPGEWWWSRDRRDQRIGVRAYVYGVDADYVYIRRQPGRRSQVKCARWHREYIRDATTAAA